MQNDRICKNHNLPYRTIDFSAGKDPNQGSFCAKCLTERNFIKELDYFKKVTNTIFDKFEQQIQTQKQLNNSSINQLDKLMDELSQSENNIIIKKLFLIEQQKNIDLVKINKNIFNKYILFKVESYIYEMKKMNKNCKKLNKIKNQQKHNSIKFGLKTYLRQNNNRKQYFWIIHNHNMMLFKIILPNLNLVQ